jgi:hydrogenase maturation protease
MSEQLIIGYGNPDRQDDGVGWQALRRIAQRLGRSTLEYPSMEIYDLEKSPGLLFTLQLTPELAEILVKYDEVYFIDAHTGVYLDDLAIIPLEAEFQASPFTHHITPQTLLSLTQGLYGKTPKGTLISAHGFEFGFSNTLSPKTFDLVEKLVEWILSKINPSSQEAYSL